MRTGAQNCSSDRQRKIDTAARSARPTDCKGNPTTASTKHPGIGRFWSRTRPAAALMCCDNKIVASRPGPLARLRNSQPPSPSGASFSGPGQLAKEKQDQARVAEHVEQSQILQRSATPSPTFSLFHDQSGFRFGHAVSRGRSRAACQNSSSMAAPIIGPPWPSCSSTAQRLVSGRMIEARSNCTFIDLPDHTPTGVISRTTL